VRWPQRSLEREGPAEQIVEALSRDAAPATGKWPSSATISWWTSALAGGVFGSLTRTCRRTAPKRGLSQRHMRGRSGAHIGPLGTQLRQALPRRSCRPHRRHCALPHSRRRHAGLPAGGRNDGRGGSRARRKTLRGAGGLSLAAGRGRIGPPASTWLPQANGGAKQLTQHVTCRMALVSLIVPASMPIAFGVGRMTRSTLRRRASCRT